MKTAVVIGATSMLGRELIAALAVDGVACVTAGRHPGADIRFDLEHGFLSQMPPGLQADMLLHCAASFSDDHPEGIRKNFQVNAMGNLWVLELAGRLACKGVVYAGSLSSSEEIEPGKYTSYGLSKAHGEEILAWGMRRAQHSFCSLRFPQLYDTAGDCIRHQAWLGRIVAYASRGQDLRMPRSDGVRNFLHIEDAANLMIAAAKRQVEGILDIVHPESLTYAEIAQVAYDTFEQGGHVIIDPAKSAFRPIRFPDGAGAYAELGIKPVISMQDGMMRIREQKTWFAFGPLDVT